MSELVFTVVARNQASGVFNDVRRDAQRMGDGVKNSSKMLSAASATARGAAKAFKVLAVGAGVAAAAAGVVAVKVGRDVVKSASNMNETLSKSATIFGKNQAAIVKWSSSAATSLGMSQEAAMAGAAQFGNFFDQIGLGGKQAENMSKKLVELSSDLGSFNNAEPAEVMQAFQAATRGEYDSLQKFIPTANAAAVQTVALALTHKKSAKDLTVADKALGLYTLANRDAGKAVGDFARTSGGMANQQRILAASFQDTKTKLGQTLLPGMTLLANAATKYVVPALSELTVKHGPALTAMFTRVASRLGYLIKMLSQGNIKAFADGLGSVGSKVYAIVAALRGNEIGAAGGQFASISENGKKLSPVMSEIWARMKEVKAELPGLADVLAVVAVAIGFLADHVDTLKAALPWIIGLFVAYKLAQIGANLAAAAAIPLKIAEVIATMRLTAAMRMHTAALNANTLANGGQLGATRLGIAAKIKDWYITQRQALFFKYHTNQKRVIIRMIIAEQVATLKSIAVKVKDAVVTAAQTVAQKARAVATSLSSVANIRATATTIGHSIAMRAAAMWAGVVTAATWAWNAALAANPIGIIVLAVVALIAILVACWFKFEGFRKVVIGAWQGIVKAATWAWENVLKPTFAAIAQGAMWLWTNGIKPYLTFIVGAWKWAFSTAVDAWNNVLKPVFSAIVTGVMWLWNNGIKPYLGFIVKVWVFAFDVIKGVFVNVFMPVVRGIASGAMWIWNNGIKPALGFIVGAWKLAFAIMLGVWNNVLKPVIAAIGAAAKWLWSNAIQPALARIRENWQTVMSALRAVWNNVLRPVFDAIGNAVGAVRRKFDDAVKGIGTIWDRLKKLMSAPVKAVIDTVFNGGLIKGWNWIDEKVLGGKYHIKNIDFKGFATGGIMPGYTPGRDNSLIAVGGGEAIMRPEWTRAIGPDKINAWNDAARRGGVPAVARELRLQGFADGGIFGAVKSLGSKVWNTAKSGVQGVADFLSNPTAYLKKMMSGPLSTLAKFRDSPTGRMITDIPPRLIAHVVAKAKEFAFGPNPAMGDGAGTAAVGTLGSMQAWARSQAGKRYLFGAVGPGSYDCSGLAGNFYAMATGRPLYRRYFLANNPSMSATPGMQRGPGKGLTFLIGGQPGTGHVTTRINGMNAEAYGGNGVPLAIGRIGTPTSYFHTPWHVPGFARGGIPRKPNGLLEGALSWMKVGWPEPYLFDDGGMLQPGLTLALNRTRKPEKITPADSGEAITVPLVIKLDSRAVYNGLLKLRKNMGGIWELA